ncbi:TMEM175 family protein [Mucilaginibacter boryungensis]|uniref:DUF1211 domain-containing protein n=1 Tax=Mucilaginibacter boryungensis TaxID=768480 RepID=A0ABR9XGU0_9SPHI|nr:TMEM175 family protein [Mucilaginibacter boryungensis]MBE9666587.1 DUF1211 domain-containing protein [Mucilaginibacter boryungensis]
MNVNEEQELKKEFQLERIILFSDAVFAIILTIMVIELKLPEGFRSVSKEVFLHEMKNVSLQLFGYTLSFFFVAMFWTRHVRLFGFVKDYDKGLLVHNLLFLFCISLFPFAVSMLGGFAKPSSIQGQWGFNIYVITIFLCLFMFSFLAGYLMRNSEKLCYTPAEMEREIKWKVLKAHNWIAPLMLAVLFGMNIAGVPPQYFVYTMAVYGVVTSRVSKYYYPKTLADNKPFILRMFASRQKKSRRAKLPAGE